MPKDEQRARMEPTVEMYRAFNMGIGMMLIIPEDAEEKIKNIVAKYSNFQIYKIGQIINGSGKVQLK